MQEIALRPRKGMTGQIGALLKRIQVSVRACAKDGGVIAARDPQSAVYRAQTHAYLVVEKAASGRRTAGARPFPDP